MELSKNLHGESYWLLLLLNLYTMSLTIHKMKKIEQKVEKSDHTSISKLESIKLNLKFPETAMLFKMEVKIVKIPIAKTGLKSKGPIRRFKREKKFR